MYAFSLTKFFGSQPGLTKINVHLGQRGFEAATSDSGATIRRRGQPASGSSASPAALRALREHPSDQRHVQSAQADSGAVISSKARSSSLAWGSFELPSIENSANLVLLVQ